MGRAEFLGALRARLAGADHEAQHPHPLVHIKGVPEVVYTRDLGDLAAAYIETASALGVTVRRAAAADVVAEAVRELGVERAVLSHDPECVGLDAVLRDLGVEVVPWDSPQAAARAELGVTGAALAIAATGTLVMYADRAGGRSASLVPAVHLAVVREANLVPDASHLLRRMHERFPMGPPSQLVLASGPSRSADIESTLTIGVHGPGKVLVALTP
jgi:L-lactate dehydrogenase complex protein LldG